MKLLLIFVIIIAASLARKTLKKKGNLDYKPELI